MKMEHAGSLFCSQSLIGSLEAQLKAASDAEAKVPVPAVKPGARMRSDALSY